MSSKATLTENLTDRPQLELIRFYLLDANLVVRSPFASVYFIPFVANQLVYGATILQTFPSPSLI